MTGGRPLLLDAPPQGTWVGQAACRDTDVNFYPERGERAADAKAVCARCDVVGDCRAWALATGERYGIWGGLSEEERGLILKRARRLAAVS